MTSIVLKSPGNELIVGCPIFRGLFAREVGILQQNGIQRFQNVFSRDT